jgi:hypothetical protein
MKIETVTYRINWEKFRPGYSFFVPCIDTKIAKQTILTVTRRLQMEIIMRVVVEDGIKGLRVWRA